MSAPSNEHPVSGQAERQKSSGAFYGSGVGAAETRATLHQARRYSAFVRQMKRILPLAALGLALAVFAYALQPRDVGQLAMTFERMGTIDNDLAMINPRLTGTDNNGLPFVVTASSAVQLGPATERVQLENVRADLVTEEGATVSVTASRGIVDNETQTVEFFDGIRMSTEDGYLAETERAHADLREGIVTGDSPVSAEGAMGRLTAQGFTFERGASILNFTGNVQMQVNGAVR